MYTLALLLLGQCGASGSYVYGGDLGYDLVSPAQLGYRLYAVPVRLYSPWNAAVASLKASTSASRIHRLSPGTRLALDVAVQRVSDAKAAIRGATDTAAARTVWLESRAQLDRARLLAARELRANR